MNKPKDTTDHRLRVTQFGTKIKTQQLYVPKDGLRYRAKKVQQLLHILDDLMMNAPEKINIKDYLLVLKEYTDLGELIKKEGKLNATSKKVKARMDEAGVVESGAGQNRPDPFSN